ncbi:aminomethyl-transferring glycine dehydrogenase subunit GcvPB [Mycolicibacterium sp.]|uniref:aminomethyl-transferring glycine dehydrogenase subunit GcvPB n=1 Tax=Mycolicibacterium sp. TaxID=2320850 RepID=UPI003D136E8E
MTRLRNFQAASWDEPVIMEMGSPGQRGAVPPAPIPDACTPEIPAQLIRRTAPGLPEIAEPDVLRHYLHLSQETMGMIGVSLFGTCTMKYNPRVNERLGALSQIADVHPHQDDTTIQGLLKIVHNLDLGLRELSGMSRFVFQAGGGAGAAYLHTAVTRAYFAAKGELGVRREIITTQQAHPCNPATAAAAGFDIITLPMEEEGYPSLDALRSVLSERTAALMLNNPDDMGIYNPNIKRWVELVHEAGGLCFYDHANFNGVMSRLRARELGFDACMFMLHKTFGVPKGGGGPAVGAYGCSAELEPFLPGPLITETDGVYSRTENPDGVGRVREFQGNLHQVAKAYSWILAMGADGIREAADISVLANNYMETRLLAIPGVTKAYPHVGGYRLEMTRYSLADYLEQTGITVADVQNRMTDFGVDAMWLSHEPWNVPQPFTPEAGEGWSLEDIDYWIDVLAAVLDEGRHNPEKVRSSPHSQVVAQLDPSGLDDPQRWATTWRAYQRKNAVDV